MLLKLTVIGHLGADAVLRQLTDTTVLNFSVAQTEKYKKGTETVENTTWINVSLYGLPSMEQYLKKGTKVYLEGFPSAHAYVTKEGEQKASIELRARGITLL